MSKQVIVDAIKNAFSGMNLAYREQQGTDLSVSMEFADAKWSTGKKKGLYEASIRVDEKGKTVYMWEKTTESGQGLSFGMSGESYVQSGKTLFRKVKCVQYGPEGKVLEYELDLGGIPKAVKEAAQQNGWKFKTVLSRKKASY